MVKKRSVNNLKTCRSYYAKPESGVPHLTRNLIVDLIDEILANRKEIRELKRSCKYWESLTPVRLGGSNVSA